MVLIFTGNEFKPVCNMVRDEQILGAMYKDQGSLSLEWFIVDHVSKSYKMLSEPVYYFISEHSNILLPNYSPDNNTLSFICVHQ